ncbi:hypothetical protein CW304_28235 [Bacillus sp. UFRGS-B20]|nr:hypothetical protein CW304_28235 [Bacillus sp. UFRGS-B20]
MLQCRAFVTEDRALLKSYGKEEVQKSAFAYISEASSERVVRNLYKTKAAELERKNDGAFTNHKEDTDR